MLLEREDELGALTKLVDTVCSGEGRIAIVGGEAGIGKTSLIRALATRAEPRCRVHWGWCEALFTPRALGPLQDMAGEIDPELARLLRESTSQERIFPVLLAALQAAERPQVLVFEDVHWADNATLDLLRYLGRRIIMLPALLVVSARTDEIDSDHPIAHVLGDLPPRLTHRIHLEPLTLGAVATLAATSDLEADTLHRITSGNPFFVSELIANRRTGDGQAPDSVRDAVWARLARMSDAERSLLEAMSIVPGSVETWLLHALLGEGVEATIDRCVARRHIAREAAGTVRFRHELARQATLAGLSTPAQRNLHARVEAAMSRQADAGETVALARLAHHASGAQNADRVLAVAPMAAAEAARLGAHQQAAAHYAAALQYAERAPPAIAAQLHESWAYEAGLAIGIDQAVIEARSRAITLWRGLDRPDKVALNLRWLSRLYWYRGEADKARQLIEEAIETLTPYPDSPELAMVFSTRSQLHMLHDETDEAIAWGTRALALAEAHGEIETKVHALNNIASAMLLAGRQGAHAMMEESLALTLANGLHEQAARAYTNYADYAVSFKELELAERLCTEGIAFDTQHDLDFWTHYLIGRQAHLRLDQGRFEEAEAIARGVLAIDRLTLIMRLPARIVLAKVAGRRGYDDADALLQIALGEALATGEMQYIVPVRMGRAESFWLTNRDAAARAELEALAALRLAGLDCWELGELAVWWQRCGMAAPFPGEGLEMAAPRAAELAGDHIGAAELWLARGLPYEAALCLSHASGATGDQALRRAVAMLDELAATPVAAMARRRARSLGLEQIPGKPRGPYAARRAHPLGLTAKELRVMRLIADGLSNQAIAERLSRSPRTVEHHVSAVLAKLNARTRMDVMLRLRSEPWLLPDPPAVPDEL